MAYASSDEFLASINTYSLPSELLDGYVIDAALEDASAMILSYISVAYEDLTAPYDRALKRKCIDIAYYYLMNKRGFNPANSSDVVIANDYTTALQYLKEIQKNRVILTNKSDSANNLLNAPFVDGG
jgi:phage gp36-like protein